MNIKTKKELNLFLDNKKSKISIYEIWKQVKQATSELKIVIDNIPIANKMFIQGQEQTHHHVLTLRQSQSKHDRL